MEKYNIVFCVVTYKNHEDLLEFINGLKQNDNVGFTYKIIVVNNYADDESLGKIKKIALSNNCEFIESENNGYSQGNNKGIDFAKSHYEFDYLVVCNPDTVIQKLNFESLQKDQKSIIVPEIICLNGKKQNPMYFKYIPVSEKIIYHAFKNRHKLLFFLGVAINKFSRFINRIAMNVLKKDKKNIYAGHGSYLIFSRYAIEKLYPVFDENIFLFCEESDLAKKAKQKGINFIYNRNIVIIHKEDGSMNLSNNNLNEIHRESYLYYYRKWRNV